MTVTDRRHLRPVPITEVKTGHQPERQLERARQRHRKRTRALDASIAAAAIAAGLIITGLLLLWGLR